MHTGMGAKGRFVENRGIFLPLIFICGQLMVLSAFGTVFCR
jgi:hypothetical protein